MSRNGSGQFSLVTNSWNPATNGQLASAGDWQALINDIAASITQSLSRDGQGGMTGNLPMGGNSITGLSDASGTGQALTFAQLFNQGTEADLASAATTDIGAQLTNFLRITGTTTITSFGTNYKGPRFLRFAGAVLLTNSATLALPGGANITTAAGDCLIAIPTATLGTADGWKVVAYQNAGFTVGKGAGSVATNTAVGASALAGNTTGATNTAVGNVALPSNTTGSGNGALGYFSLYSNTTGASNTALGYASLANNTTASNNTAVGYQAGYTNTTGAGNTFIGNSSGYSFTGSGNTYNTFVGNNAGYSTTGSYNTFIGAGAATGAGAGFYVTTGTKNTIIGGYNGNQGALDIRTASNYIVLSDGDGNPRGFFNDSGYFRINNADGGNYLFKIKFAGDSQEGIGLQSSVSGSGNMLRFLNSAGTTVGLVSTNNTNTTYATSSDYRLKNTIAPMTGALETVAALKPVTYKWNIDGSDGQGFIAHELQSVMPDCVTGEKDAVDADGMPVYQAIDVSFLVATLTAAIQELKAEFDAYKEAHP